MSVTWRIISHAVFRDVCPLLAPRNITQFNAASRSRTWCSDVPISAPQLNEDTCEG